MRNKDVNVLGQGVQLTWYEPDGADLVRTSCVSLYNVWMNLYNVIFTGASLSQSPGYQCRIRIFRSSEWWSQTNLDNGKQEKWENATKTRIKTNI